MAVLAWVGCTRQPDPSGVGTLTFGISENDQVTVKSGTGGHSYALWIHNQAGEEVGYYPDFEQIRNTSIRLTQGVYTVTARSTDATDDPFGIPRFGGSTEVTITAGKDTPKILECRLTNAKVQVEGFDDEIKDKLYEYSLTVQTNLEDTDGMVFTDTEVENEQIGWVDQTDEGTFVLVFQAKNSQSDAVMTYVTTMKDVLPADFYRFKVKMNTIGDPSDGGVLFRLYVRTEWEEYEFPLIYEDQEWPIPTITDEEGEKITAAIVTSESLREGDQIVHTYAKMGMQRLRVMHSDQTLLSYGVPGMFYIIGGDGLVGGEDKTSQLRGIIEWNVEESKESSGDTFVAIDFTGLMNTTLVGGEPLPLGSYDIEIQVLDNVNQMVKQEIELAVIQGLATAGVDAWAKFAYVNANWYTDYQPAGLAFEYRKALTEDPWIKWTGAVTIDASSQSFSARIDGLEANTRYEYRAVCDTPDEVPSSLSAMFTTEPAPDIENLNFDTWTSDGASRATWYPNGEAADSWWATGNSGLTGLAGKNSISTPSDETVFGYGKAARLETVTGVTLVGVAAGNIFLGSYATSMSNPASSAKMGRPYTGRPLGMKGYYKYEPKIVETEGNNYSPTKRPEAKGKLDQCTIYIILEDWGTATSRPSNPTVIGQARYESEDTVTDYEQLTLKIEYYDTQATPTHAVLVMSASRYGDDFVGASGSLLFVDEFELIWDWDVLEEELPKGRNNL